MTVQTAQRVMVVMVTRRQVGVAASKRERTPRQKAISLSINLVEAAQCRLIPDRGGNGAGRCAVPKPPWRLHSETNPHAESLEARLHDRTQAPERDPAV